MSSYTPLTAAEKTYFFGEGEGSVVTVGEVDYNGGRISDPCVLDGISTALRSLTCIDGLMGGANGDIQPDTASTAAKSASAARAILDK